MAIKKMFISAVVALSICLPLNAQNWDTLGDVEQGVRLQGVEFSPSAYQAEEGNKTQIFDGSLASIPEYQMEEAWVQDLQEIHRTAKQLAVQAQEGADPKLLKRALDAMSRIEKATDVLEQEQDCGRSFGVPAQEGAESTEDDRDALRTRVKELEASCDSIAAHRDFLCTQLTNLGKSFSYEQYRYAELDDVLQANRTCYARLERKRDRILDDLQEVRQGNDALVRAFNDAEAEARLAKAEAAVAKVEAQESAASALRWKRGGQVVTGIVLPAAVLATHYRGDVKKIGRDASAAGRFLGAKALELTASTGGCNIQ